MGSISETWEKEHQETIYDVRRKVDRLESELAAMTAENQHIYDTMQGIDSDLSWAYGQLSAMTRRAECAISDLARAGLCENCKHADSDECSETCGDSDSAYRWEWRGPNRNGTEDNTNETTASPSAR